MSYKRILLVFSNLLLIILFTMYGNMIFFKNGNDIIKNVNSNEITVDSLKIDEVILPLSEDAGWDYINKIYFVGDSTTYHFYKGGVDKSHILVPDSLTLKLTSNITNVMVGNSELTIAQAINKANCEIVILTIGVNGADNFSETKYKTYYQKLIDAILEISPNTKIIIQSVFPVTKAYSDENKGITNSGINRLNEWAMQLAYDNGLSYLDTQSILKDDTGAQYEYYNVQDGIHMNEIAYEAIIYYIRTHAIE